MRRRNVVRLTVANDDDTNPPNVQEIDHRGKVVKKKRKRTHQVNPAPIANVAAPSAAVFDMNDVEIAPPERLQYPGDVTQEQIIAHLNDMDIPVYGGKVNDTICICFSEV